MRLEVRRGAAEIDEVFFSLSLHPRGKRDALPVMIRALAAHVHEPERPPPSPAPGFFINIVHTAAMV